MSRIHHITGDELMEMIGDALNIVSPPGSGINYGDILAPTGPQMVGIGSILDFTLAAITSEYELLRNNNDFWNYLAIAINIAPPIKS
jgi:hypothetical protein